MVGSIHDEKPSAGEKPIFLTILGIGAIVAGIIGILLLSGVLSLDSHAGGSSSCRLDNSGRLLDPCVPRFMIMNTTNDRIQYENRSDYSMGSAPPNEECDHFARIALTPYGGLPEDAVLSSVFESSSWARVSPNPTKPVVGTRRVVYRQVLYGMPISGNAGKMSIELGENGVLGSLNKKWLTVKESGLIPIIPQSEAIKQLRNGHGRDLPDLAFNLTIHSMSLGYYTPINATVPQYLEPVWVVNATDEIRGAGLQIYVPAEADPQGWDRSPDVPATPTKNFMQIRNNSIQPDIEYPVQLWVGTSGPVGKEKAADAIKSFTEKPDLILTYQGKFFEHGSGTCGGTSFFWDYYEFSTADCNFQVDAFTGTVLTASLNSSCSNAGIGKFILEKKKTPSEMMRAEVTNLTRDRYYHFDNRHMKLDMRQYGIYANNYFVFTGDKALQSNYGAYMDFNPDDGLLTHYTVNDDVLYFACSGGKRLKIREE